MKGKFSVNLLKTTGLCLKLSAENGLIHAHSDTLGNRFCCHNGIVYLDDGERCYFQCLKDPVQALRIWVVMAQRHKLLLMQVLRRNFRFFA